MNYSSDLLQKIDANQEIIGIIGLGYVGLPLAVSFAQAGIKDCNPLLISMPTLLR